MKESQLVARMKEVEGRLKESKIVEKCYQVARDYGKGKTEMHSDWTENDYTFSKDDLKIAFYSGPMGTHYVKVKLNGQIVLDAYSNHSEKQELRFNPRVMGYTIASYLPGKWEQKIEDLLAKPKEPPKPKIPKDPEIDPIMLKDLRKKFRLQ